ncbi:repressor of RNA polymerase III transcription MAF1 [Sphaerulina musiva SO2202]|uniref:Repressor of RNA polymerase III transcription MAF1 n=1 Tax=Sphaerulina musiva (strain SO2202) TaxID=692275 RepID=N1QM72_SPHMS|nr:repressor of RNA polymerase III transcription MAF1 [Sphaerulina musiva SO2202]EMF16983.1 repressor of RNA polymerase III transcription MAF1 [Sphaerulina musiva SO2202]
MKYLPVREIDIVTNALNFSTPDTHLIGGCDMYTTKAAGGDKKLYKNIENSLESQYESLVRLSASLSPPRHAPSDDGHGSERIESRRRGCTVEAPEIDLSRASPFGPLSQITARRTFAYLIATLNASHPDYDFSRLLRPSDFNKQRSLRSMMHKLDSTLQHLRPRQTTTSNYLVPSSSLSSSAPGPGGNDIWNQNMWRLIDKEMGLRQCEKYTYDPEDDPFDGDEGAIWSMHYFFFNKEKKRVCYIYLRAFSVISHSPLQAAITLHRPKPASRKVSSLSVGEGAEKRAAFWLSSDMLRSIDTISYGEDDDDEMIEVHDDDDDESEVPPFDLEDFRNGLSDGSFSYSVDEYAGESDNDWTSRELRDMSEEIVSNMDMEA